MEREVAKVYKISEKELALLKDGYKAHQFDINSEDLIVEKDDILEFDCGDEKVYCRVVGVDTSSNNIADGVYGSILWGNQSISDYLFEKAIDIYNREKANFKGKEGIIKKQGLAIFELDLIKDLGTYIAQHPVEDKKEGK